MNMNDLFISISTAIEQIDTAVTAKGNKGIIGYVLRKCKLFDLPLYQIDQETNQIKQVHSIISEPIYEYFKEKYPPKPRDTVSNILELAKPFTYTSEPFKLSEYFWRIDEFKNQTHEIFDIADIPAISYQVSQDVQELQAQIQDLQQQLQEAQAHIKELEQQPKQTTQPSQGDAFLTLGAVMDCIKEVAKSNYTQQNLIDIICKKHKELTNAGISVSTLSKQFPESKRYLMQHKTAIEKENN